MGKVLWIHVLRDHVGLGAVVAALLKPLLGNSGALLYWIATVGMDVDHYLSFVARSGLRDLCAVGKMLRYHRRLFEAVREGKFLTLDLFHTVEFLGILAWATWMWPSLWLRAILWGCLIHFVTDIVHLARHGRAFVRATSVIEYWIRRRRMAARGLFPHRRFQEILRDLA